MMRAIYFGTFPIVLGLLVRPPRWDVVAVGAALWLFGGLCVQYRGQELPGDE